MKKVIAVLKGVVKAIVIADIAFARVMVACAEIDATIANALGVETPRCKMVITKGKE